MSKLIKEMLDALNAVNQNKTQPFDRQGEVKRIEGKIAWVKLEGSDRETPIQMTIACDVGDTVQARIGGGSAWLTGNVTAPPTDDKKANEAIMMVTNVVQEVQETLEDVSAVDDVSVQYCLSDSSSTFVQYGDWSNTPPTYVSGKYYWTRSVLVDDDGNETYGEPRYSQDTQLSVETDVAFKANNQHFWHDSSGAYVTTVANSYASGYATRVTSNGILQSYNGNLLSGWTGSGIAFYAGNGTTASNSTLLASFGSGGTTLYDGSGGYRLDIASSGMDFKYSSDTVLKFYYNSAYEYAYIQTAGTTHTAQLSLNNDSTTKRATIGATYSSYQAGVQAYASSGTQAVRMFGDYIQAECPIYSGLGSYKLLTIGTVTGSALTISANSTNSDSVDIQSPTGYTPIGIIGMSRIGTSSTYVNIYNWYLSGTTIYWAGRNLHTSDATVTPTFYVLYIATTQGV